jgi:hypothetical protein
MWRSDTASLGVILGRAKKREKRFSRDDERSKVKKRSRLFFSSRSGVRAISNRRWVKKQLSVFFHVLDGNENRAVSRARLARAHPTPRASRSARERTRGFPRVFSFATHAGTDRPARLETGEAPTRRTSAMDDAPPVTVPTAVREPFDFGDEPFGDHDAIASVLDDAGRMLGVERDAGRASKAAPSVFDKVTRSEYAAPSAAAAAAAQKAVADELEALADGFPAEESLGVQIGTIGRSGAVAAATAAVATDAKAARRADQLKKYGRAGPRGTGASSGKNHARLPKSVYAQDLEARDRAKAEREAREAKARAPFITAKYGVKLPAPVSSLQIGEKSAKARARRAALGAAKQAKAMRLRVTSNANEPSPFAAVPWRVNANVAHDVTDPISVSFNEAKRARAKAELKAKEERLKRDPNGVRGARVDRSKYPSFKAWLDAQAEHDAKLRAQMPGYVDAARAANAKRREAAYMEKVRLASGVPNAPGESKLEPSDVTSNLGGDFASNSSSANAAPAVEPVHRADGGVRGRLVVAKRFPGGTGAGADGMRRGGGARSRRGGGGGGGGRESRGGGGGGGDANRRGGVRGRRVATPSRGCADTEEGYDEKRDVHLGSEPSWVAAVAVRLFRDVRAARRRRRFETDSEASGSSA